MEQWKQIKTYRGRSYPGVGMVDLWMQWGAWPSTMGMADAFRVPDCWKKDGKWFHYNKGDVAELNIEYITHWMPTPKPPRAYKKRNTPRRRS